MSTGSIARVILPLMIRETSSTSSISRTCASAFRSITSTACAVRSSRSLRPQNPRPPENGIQRRAELVRQRAQEFVFETIGLLRLSIQLNPVERQTDPPRDVLDHQRLPTT